MRRHSVGSWIFFVGNLCRLFSHFTSHSLNSSHVCLSHHHENCQQISGLSSGENFSSNSKNLVEGQFFPPQEFFLLSPNFPPLPPLTHTSWHDLPPVFSSYSVSYPPINLPRKPQIFGDSKNTHKSVNPEERDQLVGKKNGGKSPKIFHLGLNIFVEKEYFPSFRFSRFTDRQLLLAPRPPPLLPSCHSFQVFVIIIITIVIIFIIIIVITILRF